MRGRFVAASRGGDSLLEVAMPADLLPKEAIAGVAARVNAPDTLRVLRRIQRERFIFNNAELDGNDLHSAKRNRAFG